VPVHRFVIAEGHSIGASMHPCALECTARHTSVVHWHAMGLRSFQLWVSLWDSAVMGKAMHGIVQYSTVLH